MRVVLLGDFNARVGKSVEMDDVIGMFGEDVCNESHYAARSPLTFDPRSCYANEMIPVPVPHTTCRI